MAAATDQQFYSDLIASGYSPDEASYLTGATSNGNSMSDNSLTSVLGSLAQDATNAFNSTNANNTAVQTAKINAQTAQTAALLAARNKTSSNSLLIWIGVGIAAIVGLVLIVRS